MGKNTLLHSECFGRNFSDRLGVLVCLLPFLKRLFQQFFNHITMVPGRLAQSRVTLTANQGVAGSSPVRPHTFVEI